MTPRMGLTSFYPWFLIVAIGSAQVGDPERSSPMFPRSFAERVKTSGASMTGACSRRGQVKVVCALQRGGWYALGTAWQTAEGRLLSLWISDGSDRFTKVINDYWYQAPR